MTWLVTLTDDAWADYERLSVGDQTRLRELFFDEWVPNGPTADGARLSEGIVVRHKEFAPARYVRYLVPSEQNVLVLRLLTGVI